MPPGVIHARCRSGSACRRSAGTPCASYACPGRATRTPARSVGRSCRGMPFTVADDPVRGHDGRGRAAPRAAIGTIRARRRPSRPRRSTGRRRPVACPRPVRGPRRRGRAPVVGTIRRPAGWPRPGLLRRSGRRAGAGRGSTAPRGRPCHCTARAEPGPPRGPVPGGQRELDATLPSRTSIDPEPLADRRGEHRAVVAEPRSWTAPPTGSGVAVHRCRPRRGGASSFLPGAEHQAHGAARGQPAERPRPRPAGPARPAAPSRAAAASRRSAGIRARAGRPRPRRRAPGTRRRRGDRRLGCGRCRGRRGRRRPPRPRRPRPRRRRPARRRSRYEVGAGERGAAACCGDVGGAACRRSRGRARRGAWGRSPGPPDQVEELGGPVAQAGRAPSRSCSSRCRR